MKDTMKACNLYAVGDLRYENVPMQKMESGEVLLQVKACGICGSDIPRVFEKGTYHFPTIPGHEFAGVIADTADREDMDLIGKRVAIFPCCPAGSVMPVRLANIPNAVITTITVPAGTALLPNI